MNTTPRTGTGTQTPPPRTPWRFVRRERGRMIGGVAAGMADAFNIEAVVLRVLWVIAAIATAGVAIAAYVICWVAFPSDEQPAPLSEIRRHNPRVNAGLVVGLALLGLGLTIVFGEAVPPFRHGGNVAWATVLIGAGVAVLLLRRSDHEVDPPGPLGPARATPFADVTTPAEPSTTEAPTAASSITDGETETDAAPDETATTATDALTTTAWTQHTRWPAPPSPPWPPRRRRPRPRSFLTPLTISLLLLGAGAAALLDSTGAVHPTVAGVLAAALLVVGAALVVSTWFGRARGLIPIGVLLLLATIPAVTIDVPISGGVGERRYHPATRAELRRHYELGIGHVVLDLRGAPLSDHATTISGSLGIGELDVDLPADVRVDVRAHTGAGATQVFGRLEDGWPQDTHRIAGRDQTGVLHLDLRVGAGSIHVRRWDSDGAIETN